jgi:hypothetical protein
MAALPLFVNGSAAVKQKSEIHFVPPHCVEVDRFGKACPAAKNGGYDCDRVHIKIKLLPECREFDQQNFVEIPRTK